jgi:murein DD-endopeptidase MepM/ murein hydrolase activator NlpD
VDPLAEKYPNAGPYNYCFGNPINLVDPDGNRPIPLNNKYKNWSWKIDSWFGPRNTGLPGASKFHRGLDFNYSGGGNTDVGSPILATHEGRVTAKNNTSGGEGRSVVITSPDGKFRTRYFHLSSLEVQNGEYVNESDNIGTMGGSANGGELGRTAHLHYEIQTFQNGKWTSIDPTNGKSKNFKNIIDPQKWINNVNLKPILLNEVVIRSSGSNKRIQPRPMINIEVKIEAQLIR